MKLRLMGIFRTLWGAFANLDGGYVTRISANWWYMPTIPAARKRRQEDSKFEALLGYTVRLYSKSFKTEELHFKI